jgi:hypothetical protein
MQLASKNLPCEPCACASLAHPSLPACPCRYRKNVQHVLVVGPGPLARLLLGLARPFISRKAVAKVKQVVACARRAAGRVIVCGHSPQLAK